MLGRVRRRLIVLQGIAIDARAFERRIVEIGSHQRRTNQAGICQIRIAQPGVGKVGIALVSVRGLYVSDESVIRRPLLKS